jgi:hypothetical protein
MLPLGAGFALETVAAMFISELRRSAVSIPTTLRALSSVTVAV